MDTITQNIDLKNLDKSTWKPFRFDQIAKSVSERVDPNTTDLKIYVGLEHLDADNIHIKRKGTPADVEGQKLKCYPGDVIFGKRRAYQRKAAIADFEGICSAHAFVLRANPKVIDPNLFPFFLHSDLFMHRAIDISVGGLSPTINWGNLKEQEFLLPPKEEHAQLAELLWAMDEVIEKEVGVLNNVGNLKSVIVEERCLKAKGNLQKLHSIIDKLESGVSVNSEDGSISEIQQGVLKTNSVSKGYFQPEESKKVIDKDIFRLKTLVKGNSIIISRMNTVELVGANAFVNKDFNNLYLPDRLWQTCISRQDVNVKFLWFILSSSRYRKRISELCTGTSNSMKNISQKSFLDLDVILPDIEVQNEVAMEIDTISDIIVLSQNKISASKTLQKSLINQIF